MLALGAFMVPRAHAADLEQLAKRVQILEDHPLPEGSGTIHVLTNDQIVIDGDRASSVTKWFYLTPGDDKAPKPTYLGHYDDQFIRENGHWKFLRRQSVSDISPLRK